jgi:hypothetical protein
MGFLHWIERVRRRLLLAEIAHIMAATAAKFKAARQIAPIMPLLFDRY